MGNEKMADRKDLEMTGADSALDLVVPFTSVALTRVAMEYASGMGAELTAAIRLIKIQLVPYPMELNQPPVFLHFLEDQLEQFRSALPFKTEILLARDFAPCLLAALRRNSITVIGFRKRHWRTFNERLAARLQRAGHNVVLVPKGLTNARSCLCAADCRAVRYRLGDGQSLRTALNEGGKHRGIYCGRNNFAGPVRVPSLCAPEP
jgi:hypothetical protein